MVAVCVMGLVLTSCSLTCLELLKVPVADLHVAIVFIQAPRKVASVNLASSRRGTFLVAVDLARGCSYSLLFLFSGGMRATATKNARESGANGVSNARTDCNTCGCRSHLCKQAGLLRSCSHWNRFLTRV